MTDVTLIIDYGHEFTRLRGFGRVYQGSGPDIGMHVYPDERERMLVQMAKDIGGLQCKNLSSILFMGIDDGPTGVLPDQMLTAMTDFFIEWLRHDRDLVIGCIAGVSRSGYINIALMMALTGWSFQRCLLRVRQARPQVNPMQCFVDQLMRFETGAQMKFGRG